MKNLFYIFILVFVTSCGNEKTLLLPEVNKSDTNEVLDVSPGYIFYDETKPDSLELNRKNLISTTNWLINVDKRLTLKQVIPSIVFLQEKKRNAEMHKNEAAKNYFTCNDTSIKNLGFLEFTDVIYKTYKDEENFKDDTNTYVFNVIINSIDSIIIDSLLPSDIQTNNTIIKALRSKIESVEKINKTVENSNNFTINFSFNRKLTFQDYISIKSLFKDFQMQNTTISKNEYIY